MYNVTVCDNEAHSLNGCDGYWLIAEIVYTTISQLGSFA